MAVGAADLQGQQANTGNVTGSMPETPPLRREQWAAQGVQAPMTMNDIMAMSMGLAIHGVRRKASAKGAETTPMPMTAESHKHVQSKTMP